MLVENINVGSIIVNFNTAVTDIANWVPGEQRRKTKS